MKIEIRTIGDAQILDCSGKLMLGEGTMSIRNAVGDALKSGTKKIILNLADISYIDSSGVGELALAYTLVINSGWRLKLLHLPKRIREVLAITRVLPLFEVFDDEKAILASFG